MVLDLLKKSLELAKQPSDAVKLKSKADLVKPIILMAIVGAVVMAVSSFVQGLYSFNMTAAASGLVVGAIMGAIFVPIAALIFSGIVYIVAKLLGGKGTFTQQFYLVTLATATGSLLIGVLGVIPCLGALISIVGGLYLLYVEIVVMRDLHQISTVKAAVAVLTPIVILLILAFVLFMAFIVAMLAALGIGAAGASAAGGAY
ncbi:MAG: Yip1 family protein [Candidatus Micrarchaeia archaeon]